MDRQGYLPARANIYDRNGHALVAQADATAIGLFPDKIDPAQSAALYTALAELSGLSVENIQARIAAYPAGSGWYLPLGEVPADLIAQRFNELSGFSGLVLEPYKSRYYFDNGVAPHVVGYMGEISADQIQEYEQLGYRPGDRIGLSGLENWGEPYLAGKRGGALYVRNAQGQPVTRLAEAPPKPVAAIYTTIDRDFQEGVQQSMAGFSGAAVVLERDTGRVLAMVSLRALIRTPSSRSTITARPCWPTWNDPAQPLLNRATQGLYPLGSVFKIITMAAALESGLYERDSTYYCDKVFKELPGVTLYDWTYDYDFPRQREPDPAGRPDPLLQPMVLPYRPELV